MRHFLSHDVLKSIMTALRERARVRARAERLRNVNLWPCLALGIILSEISYSCFPAL